MKYGMEYLYDLIFYLIWYWYSIRFIIYHFNLRWSTVSFHFSGNLYLFFDISNDISFLCEAVFRALYNGILAILPAILLKIKFPVASAIFSIFSSFKCIYGRIFGKVKMASTVFTTYVFTYIFANNFIKIHFL